MPANYKYNYYMSYFSLSLNNLTEELNQLLPPTDSRRRPDQRALEEGNYKLAAAEKHRLEEKQRATRKRKELVNEPHRPSYFKLDKCDYDGK